MGDYCVSSTCSLHDFSDKAAVSREAAAELERLQKSKKMAPEAKPNGPDSAAS